MKLKNDFDIDANKAHTVITSCKNLLQLQGAARFVHCFKVLWQKHERFDNTYKGLKLFLKQREKLINERKIESNGWC